MTAVKTDFELGKDSVTPALRKMQGEVDKLTKKNQRLATTSKGAADTSNRGLQVMAAQAAVAALAYRGLTKAISLGNEALSEQVRLQNLSRDANISLAQAQSNLLINLGLDTTAKQKASFLETLRDIRQEADLSSLAPLTEAASNVLSALGGEPAEKRKRALQIARASAPFFRLDPEGLTEFGGALGDISTATGQSPERALGFALSILGAARIQNLGGLSVLAPLISGAEEVRQPGVSQFLQSRQAGAFAAAFGTIAADKLGRRTATTGATLFPKLAAATPGGTIFEQIERVQEDPTGKLREKITAGAFSAKDKPFIVTLLSPGGGRLFAAMQEALPTIKADVAGSRILAERLRSGTAAIGIATTEAESAGGEEQFFLSPAGQRQARTASARKALRRGLEASTPGVIGFLGRKFDQAVFDFGSLLGFERLPGAGDEVQFARESLQRQLRGEGDKDVVNALQAQLRVLNSLDNKTPAVRVSSEADE